MPKCPIKPNFFCPLPRQVRRLLTCAQGLLHNPATPSGPLIPGSSTRAPSDTAPSAPNSAGTSPTLVPAAPPPLSSTPAVAGLPWCALTWWPAARPPASHAASTGGARTAGVVPPPAPQGAAGSVPPAPRAATNGAAASPHSSKHRNAPPPPSQGSPVTLLLLPGGHCCIFTPEHGSSP